jgi:hypothetical protein
MKWSLDEVLGRTDLAFHVNPVLKRTFFAKKSEARKSAASTAMMLRYETLQ